MSKSLWYRRIVTLTMAATMAGFGLTGVASAQTITNTGNSSHNNITTTTTDTCTVQNTNRISAQNSTVQVGASGDATSNGNTSATLPWTGWGMLDPATAQTNGQSYQSWNTEITNWISQRSAGTGWNSANDNLSWAPTGSDWSSWNPVTWQTNGQSFGNWYNAVESYLDSNSSNWLLGWPTDATGNGATGAAASGSVVNSNSSSFSININNATRAVAGTNACGQSNFTPPPTGGMGGGGGWTNPAQSVVSSYIPTGYGGSGVSANGSGGYSYAPHTVSHPSTPAPPAQATPAAAQQNTSTPPASIPSVPCDPGTSSGSVAIISNTGNGSSNNITTTTTSATTVSNTNNVSVSNTNVQFAFSGNSTGTGNTSVSGGSSGAVSNGNGTAVNAGLSS